MLIEFEEDRDYQNLKIFIFGAYEKNSQKSYIDKNRRKKPRSRFASHETSELYSLVNVGQSESRAIYQTLSYSI